jgi:TonB family protein
LRSGSSRQSGQGEMSIRESKLLNKVHPIYPQAAKLDRVSGNVVLQITIDEEGKVEIIKPVSGSPLLVPAAMAAAQQWEYSPAFIGGEAVAVVTTETMTFSIR